VLSFEFCVSLYSVFCLLFLVQSSIWCMRLKNRKNMSCQVRLNFSVEKFSCHSVYSSDCHCKRFAKYFQFSRKDFTFLLRISRSFDWYHHLNFASLLKNIKFFVEKKNRRKFLLFLSFLLKPFSTLAFFWGTFLFRLKYDGAISVRDIFAFHKNKFIHFLWSFLLGFRYFSFLFE